MKRNNSYVSMLKTIHEGSRYKNHFGVCKNTSQQMTAHVDLNAVTSITYLIFTSFIRIPRKYRPLHQHAYTCARSYVYTLVYKYAFMHANNNSLNKCPFFIDTW